MTKFVKSLRSVVVAGVAVASLAACGSSGKGKDSGGGSTDTLTITTGGTGTYNTALYIAQVDGYAKKEGLNLNVSVGNGNVLNLVVGGRADLASQGPSSALPPVKDGKETSIVYSLESGPGIFGYVAGTKDVRSLSDCKQVATTTVGSATYATALAFKSILKLNYTVDPIGDPTLIVPTMLGGKVNCALASLSSVVTGFSKGIHLIIDPRKPTTEPPNTVQNTTGLVLWGMKANLQNKKRAMVKLMKALVAAQQHIASTPTAQLVDELRKDADLKVFTPDQISSTLEADKPFLSPNGGQITESDWQADIKLFAFGLPYLSNTDPTWSWANRVDMSFLKSAQG